MQLGWIDFSREERNKVMATLDLLSATMALDELGIGTLRDRYADILFPGISTIQTRAKYFVIIPYIFDLAKSKKFKRAKEIIPWINKIEDNLIPTLVENSEEDNAGIIGSRALKKGRHVRRKPSSIYWNGMRTYGILLNNRISMEQAATLIYNKEIKKRNIEIVRGEESYGYEATTNDEILIFSPIKPNYDFEKQIDIRLTNEEALYISSHIITSIYSRDSLLAFIIKNKIDISNFYFDDLESLPMPSNMKNDYRLAKELADFIYGAHIRYNVIYSQKLDIEQIEAWNNWIDNFHSENLRFEEIMMRINCKGATKDFLKKFLKEVMNKDIKAIDRCIINREKDVKGERAKLCKPMEYQYTTAIHNYKINYRYYSARTIINDILEGLGE
ncbi:DUF6361 family protein [Clostridium fallax]|uniref:Uncharacterized protein n=1 Tax=Clostridium fallax TaxID=1533 RepID=A0A1M4SLZ3_9CLOT|nr:DUF6361 family protein [Clostridium fallax]SHE33240.1 hypothetical protein SAMN05443638_10186 [Clostridium fallax]SQB07887.1 Uncharacterised protein [Clostridium fallax]